MTNFERKPNISKEIDKGENNIVQETDMNKQVCSSFPENARITRSSLTKIKPMHFHKNESEISFSNMSKVKTAGENISRSDQNSNFSKKPKMNAEEKSVYSLVALPISQLSQMNDQNIFVFDNGDSSTQSQYSTIEVQWRTVV